MHLRFKIRLQNLPDYGGSEDLEEAVAVMWRKVGIEPELVQIQETEYRNINDQLGWKDLVTISASSNFDIQAWRVYNSSIPPRSALELRETDPIIQELLQTMDEAKQNAVIRNAATRMRLHLERIGDPFGEGERTTSAPCSPKAACRSSRALKATCSMIRRAAPFSMASPACSPRTPATVARVLHGADG